MNCCDEYCSSHGCNQGRDCPVRVARIGRRTHDRDPLPPSPWRAYLRHLAKWLLIVLALMIVVPTALSLALAQAKQPKPIDCRALIAGWHPDVPAHIQIKCRKAAHA